MDRLISAIQFITILPAGAEHRFRARGMIAFFPIVGLIIGALMSALDLLLSNWWSSPIVALADVVFLAVVTGAFHIDGLGDTADGLLAHHGRERALEIMKDSRLGTMGVVAIALVLSAKWCGIMELGPHRHLLFVLIPAYARAGMIFGIYFLEYGRPGGGTGLPFFTKPLSPKAFIGLFPPVAVSIFLGMPALVLNSAFILITAGMIAYYRKRIGCITGDMLGAMTEVQEALLFLLFAGCFFA